VDVPALAVGFGLGNVGVLGRGRRKVENDVDVGVGLLPEDLVAKRANIPGKKENRFGRKVRRRM
jgi:hypothetical protein